MALYQESRPSNSLPDASGIGRFRWGLPKLLALRDDIFIFSGCEIERNATIILATTAQH